MFKYWPNFLFACLFFSSCSTTPKQKEPPVGQRGVLGVTLRIVDNKLLVTDINPGSAAGKSGLQLDDYLVGYNGRSMESLEDRQAFWREVNRSPGKIINLIIERRGQQIPVELTISKRAILADQQVLEKLDDALDTHKKVALAVVVTQVSFVGYKYGIVDEVNEKVAAKAIVGTHFEKTILSSFGERENFVMVDRNKLEELLKELHFQGSGVVSPEFVKDIGRMTGASHIVFIDWLRYANGNDITNLRLIDVESGTVLAIDTLKDFRPTKEKSAD